jgi:serine protease
LGPEVSISAPAGNCVNLSGPCLLPISTATNFGTTTPAANGYTDQLNFNIGTSFSAPIVAAIAGLMLSTNGNLGVDEMRERLGEGAKKPFPVSADPAIPMCHVPTGPNDLQGTECNCTTATCGAGLANALGAVQAALRPIAAVAVPASVSAGQDVQLSASGSGAACGRTISSYTWSIASGSGVIAGNPTPSTAVVVAPASGSFTVRVVVTDDAGRSDSADVLVTSTTALTAAPANAGSTACLAAIAAPVPPALVTPSGGGGGGGGTGWFDVVAVLALLGFARARRARSRRSLGSLH